MLHFYTDAMQYHIDLLSYLELLGCHLPCFTQLSARYYMSYTGMDQDRVEMNTNRDYFMTPEDAVLEVRVQNV